MYTITDIRLGQPGAHYTRFEHILNHKEIFDRTESLTRADEPRIWRLGRFERYYRERVDQFGRLLDVLGPVDNVFFFSDKEKPVEILIALAKEKFQSQSVLVDEGVVSYSYKEKPLQELVKRLIVKAAGLRYISDSVRYGGSTLFDIFLTYNREYVALPVKHIEEMAPVTFSGLKPFLQFALIERNPRTALFVSSALGGHLITQEEEFALIRHVCQLWHQQGYQVVLKPHPLERDGKYEALKAIPNLSIFDHRLIPTELLVEEVDVVLGVNSSSLLNVARMGGKRVLSYINYLTGDFDSQRAILEAHGILCPVDEADHGRFVAGSVDANAYPDISTKPRFHELPWLVPA